MPRKIADNIYILDYIIYEKDYDLFVEKIKSFHFQKYKSGETVSNIRNRPLKKRYTHWPGIVFSCGKDIGIIVQSGSAVYIINIHIQTLDKGLLRVWIAENDISGKPWPTMQVWQNNKNFSSLYELINLYEEKRKEWEKESRELPF